MIKNRIYIIKDKDKFNKNKSFIYLEIRQIQKLSRLIIWPINWTSKTDDYQNWKIITKKKKGKNELSKRIKSYLLTR